MQRFGGISRYFIELGFNLEVLDVSAITPDIETFNEYYCKSFGKAIPYKDLGKYGNYIRWMIMDEINKRKVLQYLHRTPVDIFHPTYYDPYFIKHLKDVPYVVTVHDMIHDLYPSGFRDADVISKNRRILVEGAEKVITISENTKKDVIKLLGTDPDKIVVTHLATSLKKTTKVLTCLKGKYILYVGDRKAEYKNFERFFRVMRRIYKEDSTIHLVVAGGEPLQQDEGLHWVPIDSDETLAALYQQASLYVLPSTYEGFGIPLLEAMSCGCPVTCSNNSSLPEVARDAAMYFDSTDEIEMKDVITNAVNDKDLSLYFTMKGYSRSMEFSWIKTAEQTKRIYESIL